MVYDMILFGISQKMNICTLVLNLENIQHM